MRIDTPGGGLDVDVDALIASSRDFSGLSDMLGQLRRHADALREVLRLGTSPQAHDLNRKFADRHAALVERLEIMDTQLVGIQDAVRDSAESYLRHEDDNRARFGQS
ncbi:hypothetical protein [Saccharothrix violaceirubra]|uniref:Excreted virulence factor EspC (Type VII ESX diderm) n=1 Tax=Saccharothrix violaceirubra TaxID=413306 RepID=A0A7W7T2U5_9PSEU|nr:hypothetical protein [Saccharothrix violaceirubra]MBB4965572.1 hypothetical protein [Saccharothrix violaceirubra]